MFNVEIYEKKIGMLDSQNLTILQNLLSNISELSKVPVFSTNSEEYNRYKFLRGCVIAIEGTIGAGKTTLGKNMAAYLNLIGLPAIFLEEQVCTEYLNKFYQALEKGTKPNPYAILVQESMLRQCQLTYLQAQNQAKHEDAIVIVDRTVFGNTVFAMLHTASGNIDQEEYEGYLRHLKQYAPYYYDFVIYLDVSPQKAHELITQKRKRANEKDIPMGYLYDLERAYYMHLAEQICSKHSRILVVNNEPWKKAHEILKLLKNYFYVEPIQQIETPKAIEQLLNPSFIRGAFENLCKITQNNFKCKYGSASSLLDEEISP